MRHTEKLTMVLQLLLPEGMYEVALEVVGRVLEK
jgi:hypothetical protein